MASPPADEDDGEDVAQAQQAISPFPIEILRDPGTTSSGAPSPVTSWPVTTGVPFAKGVLQAAAVPSLRVRNDAGTFLRAQVEAVGFWEDDSVRWLRVSFEQPMAAGPKYFLDSGTPPTSRFDDLLLVDAPTNKQVRAWGVQYRFLQRAFPEIRLDANGDGSYAADEVLSNNAGTEVYAVLTGPPGIEGARVTLQSPVISFEAGTTYAGPVRYAVVKVEGDYVDAAGTALARGALYYHFSSWKKGFKLEHKFVFTKHGVGLSELGIRVPVTNTGVATATLEDSPGHSRASSAAAGPLRMTQVRYPAFNDTRSTCTVRDGSNVEPPTKECGAWADLTGWQNAAKKWGLGVQLPGFAEQFPKGVEVGPGYLQIELWSAKEGAPELRFETSHLFANYLGNAPGQWLSAAPSDWLSQVNASGGIGKTHEIWFYPHTGDLATVGPSATFGATTSPPIAYADPAYVASTGVFGALGVKVGGEWDDTEAAMADYFDRNVLVSRRVFPPNGFLLYGMHPYVGQAWVQDPPLTPNGPKGPWHPVVSSVDHVSRLGRSFDYDLRRALFPLWIRTGDRRYYDYARQHARFSHDLQFSNHEAGIKPKGWRVVGAEDPPMLWGSFGPAVKLGTKPSGRFGDASALAHSGAEDLAQLVQAYYLTGDFHARDMVRSWEQAVWTELNHPTKPLTVAEVIDSDRPEAMIRMLGSAYELDQDEWLESLGDDVLWELRPHAPGSTVTLDHFIEKANFAKAADVFPSFYFYHVATGSPVAKAMLLDRAEIGLRFGFRERLFERGSVDLLLGSALAAKEPGLSTARQHTAKIRHAVETYGRRHRRLQELSMTVNDFNQASSADWQQRVLTTHTGLSLGLPAAMHQLRTMPAEAPGSAPIPAPISLIEPMEPVAIAFEHGSSTTLELSLNMDASDSPVVALRHIGTGTLYPVAAPTFTKRLTFDETRSGLSPWYLQTGSLASLTVSLDATHPPGQYRLTLGENVRWRLLDHTASKLVLEAPRGLPLAGFEDHFFKATGTGDMPVYSFRPVEIHESGPGANCQDKKVSLTARLVALGADGSNRDGLYNVHVNDGCLYRIRSVPNSLTGVAVDTPQDGFIRLNDDPAVAPLAQPVFAVGTKEGLFAPITPWSLGADYHAFDADLACTVPPCSELVLAGHQGSGKQFHNVMAQTQPYVMLDPAGGPDFERGTIDFWMKPHWEPSRRSGPGADTVGNTLDTLLAKLGPMELRYGAPADDEQNGTLRRAVFYFHVPGGSAVNGNDGVGSDKDHQCDGLDAINVHWRHWLSGGRWYHVTLSWSLTGVSPSVDLYIDGHPKVRYALGNSEPLADAGPCTDVNHSGYALGARLAPSALGNAPFQFGSIKSSGEHLTFGTTLDDVRLYQDALCPPGAPPTGACATPFFEEDFD